MVLPKITFILNAFWENWIIFAWLRHFLRLKKMLILEKRAF